MSTRGAAVAGFAGVGLARAARACAGVRCARAGAGGARRGARALAGAQAAGTAAYLLLGRAVELDVPALTLGWVRSAALFAAVFPIGVGGLGVREGALVLLLEREAAPKNAAAAFAFLAFAATVLPAGLAGAALEARAHRAAGLRRLRGTGS